MFENLKKYNIILASNSPRRKELLAGLGIDYKVRVADDVDESFPKDELSPDEVPLYLASKKAQANCAIMEDNDLIITADTVVISDKEVLGKPSDKEEATKMLLKLSGRTHHVVTGVCLTSKDQQRRFKVSTDVTFKKLTPEEIDYYINTYHPYDKAGAYGIQEWIGYIGVTELSGSYFNVMGLPIQRIYMELQNFE